MTCDPDILHFRLPLADAAGARIAVHALDGQRAAVTGRAEIERHRGTAAAASGDHRSRLPRLRADFPGEKRMKSAARVARGLDELQRIRQNALAVWPDLIRKLKIMLD
jgi:hypothetical protein